MKIILSFILLLFCFSVNYASELVFSKSVFVEETLETDTVLAELNTAKFKRIKIFILSESTPYNAPHQFKERLDKLNSGEIGLKIEAIEKIDDFQGDVVFMIKNIRSLFFDEIIEMPPSKIRISVKGKGFYKIFIWGE